MTVEDVHGRSSFFVFLPVSSTAGSVAAQSKGKRKGGSRGKSGRMTEAEEDEQLLKSAQSKRRVIRLDTQPSILAPHCSMHNYQLEGLNWLIKLHCNGINGILADEVSDYTKSNEHVGPPFAHFDLFQRWDWERRYKPFPSWHTSENTEVSRVLTWSSSPKAW